MRWGPQPLGVQDSVVSVIDHCENLIANLFQLLAQVKGDQALILHDENLDVHLKSAYERIGKFEEKV